MKFLPVLFTYLAHNRGGRRNLLLLARFILAFIALVVIYSVIFHVLMDIEGRDYSWITGFYWTLTVMSTLGFGDITFTSDIGRLFSIAVMLSGVMYLLVLLPFTFIEFFYAPWMKAQQSARAPRKLASNIEGHVLLTHLDPVVQALIPKLKRYNYPYAVIVPELEDALRLHDEGINVIHGNLDDPDVYRACRVDQAALVASTVNDPVNTNVAFTVREQSEDVPILTTANRQASVDVLQLAGSNRVLLLGEFMGQSLGRRTIGGDAQAHEIGRFGNLIIAEATASGTPLVGKSLAQSKLRELTGTTAVGIWQRGEFSLPLPDTVLTEHSVLILAGTEEQISNYNALFCIYHNEGSQVIIIGGGRVGRSTGRTLAARGFDYKIIESRPERIRDPQRYIMGDAAAYEVLEQAGIEKATAIIITPHEDDINIYLTLYCRRLRPDIQIITRATLERNVSTIHRAGADFVMSYASMGANAILNQLKDSAVLMLAEGLDVFSVNLPPQLAGKTVMESAIRAKTSCSVIGIKPPGQEMIPNPAPDTVLVVDSQVILIGSEEAEARFLEFYRTKRN